MSRIFHHWFVHDIFSSIRDCETFLIEQALSQSNLNLIYLMSKTVIILFLNYFVCTESNRRQYTKRAYSITGRQTQLWDNSQRVPEAGPSGENWSGQKIVWSGGTEVSFLVFWKCWNSCNCCYLDSCFVAVICQCSLYSDTCRTKIVKPLIGNYSSSSSSFSLLSKFMMLSYRSYCVWDICRENDIHALKKSYIRPCLNCSSYENIHLITCKKYA